MLSLKIWIQDDDDDDDDVNDTMMVMMVVMMVVMVMMVMNTHFHIHISFIVMLIAEDIHNPCCQGI